MTDKITQKPFKKLVALDFDGVLHSYSSPWTDPETISDPPTPGAMQFLRRIVEDGRFEVVVVSSRCSSPLGVERIEEWLQRHLIEEFGQHDGHELFSSGLRVMRSDEGKLPATVTIDDRAVTFLGTWPSLDRLAAFQPWNKKPKHLRADPLTSVAAIDALMMRIGRVAQETGCPDGVQALDWLEERARIGHAVATTTSATIEKISDEDMERIQSMPVRPGAVIALPRWYTLQDAVAKAVFDLLTDETAAHSYRTEPGFRCALDQLRHSVGAPIGGERPTVDGVPCVSIDELPVPVRRWESFETGEVWQAGADGKVKLIRDRIESSDADAVKAEGRAQIDALIARTERTRGLRSLLEMAWDLGAGTAYARRDRPADYEADGKTDETIRGLDVGRVLERANEAVDVPERALRYAIAKADRLDAEFGPYAAVERIVIESVPPGTPVSRARAGGELGWRVGFGWMPADGNATGHPAAIREFAQSLAAIPGLPGEKPRNGDPELVARTLAAGRAL